MDIVKLLHEGYDWTGQHIAGVRPADLDAVTPSAQLSVRNLINYLLGAVELHTAAVLGWNFEELASLEDIDRIGTDPAAAFAAERARAMAAWQAPGALERICVMPFGPMPARMVANLDLLEVVVHGWDIAMAIGQATQIPTSLAEPILGFTDQLDAPHAARRPPARPRPAGPRGTRWWPAWPRRPE